MEKKVPRQRQKFSAEQESSSSGPIGASGCFWTKYKKGHFYYFESELGQLSGPHSNIRDAVIFGEYQLHMDSVSIDCDLNSVDLEYILQHACVLDNISSLSINGFDIESRSPDEIVQELDSRISEEIKKRMWIEAFGNTTRHVRAWLETSSGRIVLCSDGGRIGNPATNIINAIPSKFSLSDMTSASINCSMSFEDLEAILTILDMSKLRFLVINALQVGSRTPRDIVEEYIREKGDFGST